MRFQNRYHKVAGEVVTVDTKRRQVELMVRDRSIIQAAIWDTHPFFRWPKPGEHWTVQQNNGVWVLDHKYADRHEDHPIEDLNAGDGQIQADKVHLATGGGSDAVVVKGEEPGIQLGKANLQERDTQLFIESDGVDVNDKNITSVATPILNSDAANKAYVDAIAASGDGSFVYDQNTAQSIWIIDHTLNGYPSVTVVDTGGNEVYGNINYVSTTQVIVSFSAPFTGRAFLNAGAVGNYEFDQPIAAVTWTIDHPLNRYPSVTVVDSGNSQVFGAIDYVSTSQIVVSFTSAFTGKAYLN